MCAGSMHNIHKEGIYIYIIQNILCVHVTYNIY
jgi:hypothetical protein